jgi:hypothetical protein
LGFDKSRPADNEVEILAETITKSRSEYRKIEENFSGCGIEKQVICV